MPDVPDEYRRFFEGVERVKAEKEFDDYISKHLNLLIAYSRAPTASMDAMKKNIRAIFNARLAARFMGGPL